VWSSLVELVRATIFAGSHALGGSLGASIVVVSALLRLALLPSMLRAARQARAQQMKLQELKPMLERLKRRYDSDPKRLFEETQQLYRKHGVQLLSGRGLLAAAIQLPLLGALFSAVRTGLGTRVRFLWITDLSRVDALLVVLVTGLAGISASVAPPATGSPIGPRTLTAVVVGGTLLFLWSASSAVALSVGAGSVVSLLQNWMLRRDAKREAAPAR
jgi:YidC/Oxa1 family membrane protein insertase